MKKLIPVVLTFALAASAAMFLAGCSGEKPAEKPAAPAADDSAAANPAGAVSALAGKMGEVAAKLTVIEHPTAEQLAGAKPYTPDTCPKSGEKLGEMGDPVVLLIGNQTVKLCCKDCLPDVKADPAKVLAKLAK